MEDDLSRIENAIRISRGPIRAVKQNLIFAIGMKVLLLVLASLGYVTIEKRILKRIMAVMMINLLNTIWVLKYPDKGV
jgi:Cation transport ATPase